MSEVWAAAIAVAGVGASVYGTQQQKKANARAQDANAAAQQQSNEIAWSNYLLSRGIAPTVPVAPGQIPEAGQYRAVNSRLPLYANVDPNVFAQPGTAQRQPFLVKRGG